MSQPSWFDQTPQWVWLACIPIIGGGAIAYAGTKIGSKVWIGIGAGFVAATIILPSIPIISGFAALVWYAQIGTAFALKREYLVKTYPKNLPLPEDAKLFAAIAPTRPKIEINSCSKNDLVNILGLPIVYANDLDSLRSEGHIFTSLEELHDVIEIPNETLAKIAPMVIFSYDYRQESGYSWKRLNSITVDEMIGLGLEPKVAEVISQERQRRGAFKSIMDIKKRTGIPFTAFRHLT